MKSEHLGIAGFKAKKENHDTIERCFRAGLDFEESHPEFFHYKSTRYYTRDVPGSADYEYWMFIDRCDDYDDYLTSLRSAAQRPETKEVQKWIFQALSHAEGFLPGMDDPNAEGFPNADELPKMMNLIQHWVEVPSLRVDDMGH